VRVGRVGLGVRAGVGPAVGFGCRVGMGVRLRVRDRRQHCDRQIMVSIETAVDGTTHRVLSRRCTAHWSRVVRGMKRNMQHLRCLPGLT